jgi:hypothetical protein
VREALQALDSEGTRFAAPYTGALVTPLSAAGLYDIAEIRLALIALAVKPAHRHLAPLTSTSPMTWPSESHGPKTPPKLLNVPAASGKSFLRRLNDQFSRKCFGNWMIV